MQEQWIAYLPAILALGAIGTLLFLQVVVADIAGIWSKDFAPGKPLAYQPASFHFRASRSYANTNESIAVFITLLLFGLFMAAEPGLLNLMAWVYVAGRAGHMLSYYAGWQLPRVLSFTVSLLGLLGLIVAGVRAC